MDSSDEFVGGHLCAICESGSHDPMLLYFYLLVDEIEINYGKEVSSLFI